MHTTQSCIHFAISQRAVRFAVSMPYYSRMHEFHDFHEFRVEIVKIVKIVKKLIMNYEKSEHQLFVSLKLHEVRNLRIQVVLVIYLGKFVC